MLAPLGPEDIADVMRLERLEGYEAFVGRFEAEEHAAELASNGARYLGWRSGGGLEGFVIFQAFDAADRVVLLRRIAVAAPGRGVGTRLLRAAVGWLFETTDARAVELTVRPGNDRARAVYLREGFEPAGLSERGSDRMLLTREAWATPPP